MLQFSWLFWLFLQCDSKNVWQILLNLKQSKLPPGVFKLFSWPPKFQHQILTRPRTEKMLTYQSVFILFFGVTEWPATQTQSRGDPSLSRDSQSENLWILARTVFSDIFASGLSRSLPQYPTISLKLGLSLRLPESTMIIVLEGFWVGFSKERVWKPEENVVFSWIQWIFISNTPQSGHEHLNNPHNC